MSASESSTGAIAEGVKDLNIDEKADETPSLIQRDLLCGDTVKVNVVTSPKSKVGTSTEVQTPHVVGRSDRRFREKKKSRTKMEYDERATLAVFKNIPDQIVREARLRAKELEHADLAASKNIRYEFECKERLTSNEPEHADFALSESIRDKIAGIRRLTSNEPEHADLAGSKNIRKKSVTAQHKLDKLDDFEMDANTIKKRMDSYVEQFTHNLNKLIDFDQKLTSILEGFNENKVLDIFLGALQVFDSQVKYNDKEHKEDVKRKTKCLATTDKNAPCASSSQAAKESEIPTINIEIKNMLSLKDSNAICEIYRDKLLRVNDLSINRAELFKGLSDTFKSYDISGKNKLVDTLVMKASVYREICRVRAMVIDVMIKLFASIMKSRIQESKNISSIQLEAVKSTSIDAKSKEDAVNLYKRSVIVLLEIEKVRKELEEEYNCIKQKNKNFTMQSDSAVFWGPGPNCWDPNRHPNFIMTKINWLTKYNFEVFDSLRKIISAFQCIKTLADLIKM